MSMLLRGVGSRPDRAWRRLIAVPLALPLILAQPGCNRAPAAELQLPPMTTVQVDTVTESTLEDSIEAYGTVGFSPSKIRTLSHSADIEVDSIAVEAGQRVQRGQPLLRIRASIASEQELRSAHSEQQFALHELTRIQQQLARQLATNADVAQARQALDRATVVLSGATARRGGPGVLELTADADQTVVSVDVGAGDRVAAGTALLHLAGADALQGLVGIEVADLPRLRQASSVTLSALDGSATVQGVSGQPRQQLDPATGRVALPVTLPAGSSLLPGMPVRARIALGAAPALTVARAALLFDQQRPSVFRLQDRQARRVSVDIVRNDGGRVGIASGLAAGDQVIVAGQAGLEDGMRVAAADLPSPAP